MSQELFAQEMAEPPRNHSSLNADQDMEPLGGQSEVYASVIKQGKNIGVAVYNEEHAHLSLGQVPAGISGAQDRGLLNILSKAAPTTLVLPARIGIPDWTPSIIEVVQEAYTGSTAPSVVRASARHFSLADASGKIARLRTPDCPWAALNDDDPDQPVAAAVHTWFSSKGIDVDGSPYAVRAAGAILSTALSSGLLNQLEEAHKPIRIAKVSLLSMEGTMVLDPSALKGLAVFAREAHPSVHRLGRAKEGLSLLSLLDRTASPLGRITLKAWLRAPSTDISVLRDRSSLVQALSMIPSTVESFPVQAKAALRWIRDVPRLVAALHAIRATVNDWVYLWRSAVHLVQLTELLQSTPTAVHASTLLRPLVEAAPVLTELSATLHRVFDWDETIAESRLIVRPGVDNELDERKALYAGLGDLLSTVGAEEAGKLPPESPVSAFTVVYFPQLGFLLALTAGATLGQDYSAVPIEGWEYAFHTDEVVYGKNWRMRSLDIELGDVYSDIVDHEASIARSMESSILAVAETLSESALASAVLDVALAMSSITKDKGWVVPTLLPYKPTEPVVMEIANGRHPLQELCVDQFIPNSASISGSVIVTGPNQSGKSVWIKQVGLIVILAQIGCTVPAASARFTVVDALATRLRSWESWGAGSWSSSSFVQDCAQMNTALELAGPCSLIIIDEFGKGTDPDSGLAMAASMVRALTRKKARVLFATHFPHILSPVFAGSASLTAMRMAYASDEENLGPNGSVFLYTLESGIATCSKAFACATAHGLPDPVVARAMLISEALSSGATIEPTKLA